MAMPPMVTPMKTIMAGSSSCVAFLTASSNSDSVLWAMRSSTSGSRAVRSPAAIIWATGGGISQELLTISEMVWPEFIERSMRVHRSPHSALLVVPRTMRIASMSPTPAPSSVPSVRQARVR